MSFDDYLRILEKELIIAIGCTEPIAVAYAAALAKRQIPDEHIEKIRVCASIGIIKNAMAVNIPGVQDSGLKFAAALGALCGDADLHLEVLRHVTPECVARAKELQDGSVVVEIAENVPEVYIYVEIKTASHLAKVVVADRHDLVTKIELDNQVIYSDDIDNGCLSYQDIMNSAHLINLYHFVSQVPVEQLKLIELSIKLNLAIAREGMNPGYGMQVGRIIHESCPPGQLTATTDRSIASLKHTVNHAVALTAAGADARMAGVSLPVMCNSGSGNQGICATVPVVAVAEQLDLPYERLVRAVTLSHLVAIFVKRTFGRLSAMCGVVAASTGASCGIVFLMNGGIQQINAAVQNMLGNVTGMICDGAKSGCALKVSTGIFAAMQSAIISLEGIEITEREGIIGTDAESTIHNLIRLSKEGMPNMNDVLVNIMMNK